MALPPMYSSCLACHRELGRNTAIESFPIGRKLAFDTESGRIWAICPECGEWNLAPIQARWEAVEACAEVFDSLREKGSAGAVTLARSDGFDLLRVGASSELPTLRYGARLRRRAKTADRRRRLVTLVTWSSVAAGIVGTFLGMPGMLGGALMVFIASRLYEGLRNPVVARVPRGDGGWAEVTRRDLADMRLVPEGEHGWALRVSKTLTLAGAEAFEAARLTLPLLTRSTTPDEDLRKAIAYIEKKGGTAGKATAEAVFGAAARRRGARRTARVSKLETHIRLALEILASREVEERAVAEDLAHLRMAWEHADELAAIQDDMTFDMSVWGRLAGVARGD